MSMVDKIIEIANQLTHDGKKPSVALIKKHLPSPVPLPTIISTLQTWVYDPNSLPSKNATEDNANDSNKTNKVQLNTNDELSLAIANAITPLQQEIFALRQDIAALKTLIEQG